MVLSFAGSKQSFAASAAKTGNVRLWIILILSILTGAFCAYWLWQHEYSWLQIFLGYVVGGNLALTSCFAVVYAHISSDE